MSAQNNKVSLVACSRYHAEEVRSALNKLLEPFGGIKDLVKPGQRVLLKPNLLAAAKPAEAVTTHPAVMKAMAEMVRDAGARVFIGDSPGSDGQETALRVSGMREVMDDTGAEALILTEAGSVRLHSFKHKTVPLAAELEQIDLVINIAKLKTHSLTGLTGAVKNTYGLVAGRSKARFHFEHPLPLDFSRLVVEICLAVKPAFSVIDAIIAMEGTGPRRGKPRQVGLLMASPNPFALDAVAARVTGFEPDQVSTIAVARRLRLPGADIKEVETFGLPLEESLVGDFDRGPAGSGKISSLVARFPVAWFRNMLYARRPYPRIDGGKCNGCGVCVEHCPAQTISFAGDVPVIELYECIRCYCCQEFCAQGAIELDVRAAGSEKPEG